MTYMSTKKRRSLIANHHASSFTVIFSSTMDRRVAVLWAFLCTANEDSGYAEFRCCFWDIAPKYTLALEILCFHYGLKPSC
ncbi:hypothetical protein TNCV_3966231 [Trichonephila clavipes]|nr:hypothetical protein TNCV_3966231 [Trichonephila clavipes]